MDENEARRRLGKINHIVVLMMENRSFDHMLGYLSMPEEAAGGQAAGAGRADSIDGLTGHESNKFGTEEFKVAPMDPKAGLIKEQDPGHTGPDIGEQMSYDMSGFATNYATTRAYQHTQDVMRYQWAETVPVYDFFAGEFAVLDRWFCSIPGGTWPNRLASLCGKADAKDNKFPPLYQERSFVRTLEEYGVSWRWYSWDPGSLRIADDRYRIGFEDNFAHAEKPSFVQKRTFYTDCAAADLPSVSWIDPNFVDLGGLQGANDDHPPTDVMAGQSFIMKVYEALRSSRLWEESMLVITYDEHGGFYDHVDPTRDDVPEQFRKRAQFAHFGPRVPAIVVSPFVGKGAAFGSKQQREGDPNSARYFFDHTALIKTILLRFACDDCSGLPARVGSSSHLGWVLEEEGRPGKGPGVPDAEADLVADWWGENIKTRLRHPRATVPALQEMGVTEGTAGPLGLLGTALALIGRARDRLHVFLGLKWEPEVKRCADEPAPEHEEKPRPMERVRATIREASQSGTRKATPLPGELVESGELQRGVAAAARHIRGRGLPGGQP